MSDTVHPWLLLFSGLVKVMTANERPLNAINPKVIQYCATTQHIFVTTLILLLSGDPLIPLQKSLQEDEIVCWGSLCEFCAS